MLNLGGGGGGGGGGINGLMVLTTSAGLCLYIKRYTCTELSMIFIIYILLEKKTCKNKWGNKWLHMEIHYSEKKKQHRLYIMLQTGFYSAILYTPFQHMPFQYEVSYTIGLSGTKTLIYRGVNNIVQFGLPAGQAVDDYSGKHWCCIGK